MLNLSTIGKSTFFVFTPYLKMPKKRVGDSCHMRCPLLGRWIISLRGSQNVSLGEFFSFVDLPPMLYFYITGFIMIPKDHFSNGDNVLMIPLKLGIYTKMQIRDFHFFQSSSGPLTKEIKIFSVCFDFYEIFKFRQLSVFGVRLHARCASHQCRNQNFFWSLLAFKGTISLWVSTSITGE